MLYYDRSMILMLGSWMYLADAVLGWSDSDFRYFEIVVMFLSYHRDVCSCVSIKGKMQLKTLDGYGDS